MNTSTVNKHQRKGGKHFATWSFKADPDGIAWKEGGMRKKSGQTHKSKFYVPLTASEYEKMMGE